LPLTSYWDEENYDPGPRGVSPREREAVTLEPPVAPQLREVEHRAFDGEIGIALPGYGPSAVTFFWWTLLGLVVLGFLLSLTNGAEGVLIGGVIMLMVLPGMQLGSALITAVVLALSTRPDKNYQFWQLGKVVLGAVVGTVVGIGMMWFFYLVLSR
jgi:hypothetical protein